MNPNKAKLLTFAGAFCCLCALIILICNAAESAGFYFSPLLLFAGGITAIVVSLAYYTEK